MTSVIPRSGEFNRRITLQARTAGQDTWGQQTIGWSDVVTVWAKIEPASGREQEIAAAINAPVTHMVTIRWRTGVSAAMRILFGSRIFDIISVAEPEMQRVTLELGCIEGLNEGG